MGPPNEEQEGPSHLTNVAESNAVSPLVSAGCRADPTLQCALQDLVTSCQVGAWIAHLAGRGISVIAMARVVLATLDTGVLLTTLISKATAQRAVEELAALGACVLE